MKTLVKTKMTPPKKWYLQVANSGADKQPLSDADASQYLVLMNKDGLMKRAKAQHSLGIVESVSYICYVYLVNIWLTPTAV